MDVDDWLKAAIADAERRGLTELRPLLETLAHATRVLRGADWNERPTGTTPEDRPGDAGRTEVPG